MRRIAAALVLNLVLIGAASASTRTMTDSERTIIKSQLDSILKNNQDECYVNASNFNNIDVLSLANKKQKTFIEKKSRNLYLPGDLAATLNLDTTETLLPEGTIASDDSNQVIINYRRAISLNPVEMSYSAIETQDIAEGFVTHVFETQNGQSVWKYSLVDLHEAENKKPHVRCKAKGDEGFLKGKTVIKPIETNSFKFLDLEFIIPEFCLTQCSDLTFIPTHLRTY